MSSSCRCSSFLCINTILLGVLLLAATVNYCWTTNNVYRHEALQQLAQTNKNLRRKASQDEVDTSENLSVYIEKMKDANLSFSMKHQEKFHKKKNLIQDHFPRDKRYRAYTDQWAATPINDEFAYIHIYKNGGTTVAKQTGNHQTEIIDPKIRDLKWMTFVRDPIDHFLSGWAECGLRSRETSDKSYDERIDQWVDDTIRAVEESNGCAVHSFPQGNFLLNADGIVHQQIELIGDLRELVGVLDLAGFEYDENRGEGRIASANLFKTTNYPSRKDLISDRTMRRICNFVAIDYFLFDFEMPEACQENQS